LGQTDDPVVEATSPSRRAPSLRGPRGDSVSVAVAAASPRHSGSPRRAGHARLVAVRYLQQGPVASEAPSSSKPRGGQAPFRSQAPVAVEARFIEAAFRLRAGGRDAVLSKPRRRVHRRSISSVGGSVFGLSRRGRWRRVHRGIVPIEAKAWTQVSSPSASTGLPRRQRLTKDRAVLSPQPMFVAEAVKQFLTASRSGVAPNKKGRRYKPSAVRDLEGCLLGHVVPELGTKRLGQPPVSLSSPARRRVHRGQIRQFESWLPESPRHRRDEWPQIDPIARKSRHLRGDEFIKAARPRRSQALALLSLLPRRRVRRGGRTAWMPYSRRPLVAALEATSLSRRTVPLAVGDEVACSSPPRRRVHRGSRVVCNADIQRRVWSPSRSAIRPVVGLVAGRRRVHRGRCRTSACHMAHRALVVRDDEFVEVPRARRRRCMGSGVSSSWATSSSRRRGGPGCFSGDDLRPCE